MCSCVTEEKEERREEEKDNGRRCGSAGGDYFGKCPRRKVENGKKAAALIPLGELFCVERKRKKLCPPFCVSF